MREVRKIDETDRHFSAVDTVSSELFDRMSDSESPAARGRAAPAAGKPARPEPVRAAAAPESGPFSSVDNVSSEIFDRMEAIGKTKPEPQHHEEAHPPQPAGDSTLHRLGSYLRDNVLPDRSQDAAPPPNVPAGWVLVRAEDLAAVPLATVAVPQTALPPDAEANPASPETEVDQISYKAAQRRSQLPEGVEPLEGKPTEVFDDITLASIRELMVEQKRDFNRNAFPELEPATPEPEPEPDPPSDLLDEEEYLEAFEDFEPVAPNRLQAALVRFVRADTVLATCLSLWVSLFLMIFIEPELSQALAMISLLLLVIFRIMHPTRKGKTVMRVRRRMARTPDVYLEDAILSPR